MTDNSAKTPAEKSQYNLSEHSGLELLQLCIEGKIQVPMAKTMGTTLIKIEKGYALFEVKADGRHLGPFGAVHGGFAATALDSVVSCAVISLLEPGVPQVVVDLNVKMLKAIPRDKVMHSEGKVLHFSKRIAMAEGKIMDHQGTLYAHATATCMILRKLQTKKQIP